ncbi:RAB11-binding protein RELCH homolog isoform X1 [Homarus americanus]|nr:RAB11-binding protein RELCH homolog isoform X1 [Homarus americanus]
MAEAKTSGNETPLDPAVPATEIKKRERHGAVSWDDVATKLLQERLLLTALELHTELVEAGCELPRLREYFSNPANFEQYTPKTYQDLHSGSTYSGLILPRSSSQTTLDSLDWGHLSEDGERAVDERVAVLEFELRKARETIQGLRTNLTQATESKPSSVEKKEADKPALVASLSSIRPHEKRTLNFLINEYLVTNSYKLTAITFADENDDQDFEHWDDVGLNIGRPPNLVQLLREGGHTTTQLSSCASQTDSSSQCQISQQEEQLKRLQEELHEAKNMFAVQERELQKLKRRTSTPSVTPCTSPKKQTDRTQAEGHTYNTDKLSPLGVDKDGRESPEGTSDNEETSGGGGFVMVTAAAVPLRTQTIGSSIDIESEDSRENTKEVNSQDSVDHVVRSELINAVSGYEDPSESIEVLIQTSHGDTQDNLSEQLSEAMENKVVLNEEEVTVKPEISLQESCIGSDEVPEAVDENSTSVSQDQQPQVADVRIADINMGGEYATEKYLELLKTEAKQLLRASSERRPPEAFEQQILQASLGHTVRRNSRIQAEVATLGQGSQDLLNVIATSLHNIAPNVILAKREELLPLLICGVSLHKDGKERERLLHLLFNLIKRPDEEQRSTILTGLVGLARVLGATKLEAELLPQCWEQLTHKYVERRLLVAQSTATLAPYTPPPLRNSLLLSMLLQLLAPGGEKETQVREAALTSLSLLVTFLDDRDKLPVLVDTLLYCLENVGTTADMSPHATLDPSMLATRSQASPSAMDLFIASLAMWAVETNRLNLILDPLLAKLSHLVVHYKQQQVQTSPQVLGQESIISVIEALIKILPFILATLINSVPAVDDLDKTVTSLTSLSACSALEELQVIIGDKAKAEAGLTKLHQYVSKEWFKSWKELEYVTNEFLPAIVDVLSHIDTSAVPVIQAFIRLFTQLPVCFGPHITASSITPIFMKHLSIDDSALETVRLGNTGLTSSLVVVYIVALLASNQGYSDRPGELEGFLTRHISILSLCRAQPDALYVTVSTLLQLERNQESVLGALWSCVVHKSNMVRACSAGLWSVVVGNVEDGALGSRVVPALVTLATDPDIHVKASAVHPLATVITTTTNTEVLDKVWLQLETLAEDPSLLENLNFQLALCRTCSRLAHTAHPRLIHQFLLPRLCRLAMDGRHNEEEGAILGVGLLEAYSSLTCCHLPDHVVAHFVLPPLTQLQKTLGSTTFEHMETITDLLREYSLRTQASQGLERRKSNLSLTGSLPVHPGVDDMKNKMSKMFASRPSANVLQAKAQAINVSLPGFLKKK